MATGAEGLTPLSDGVLNSQSDTLCESSLDIERTLSLHPHSENDAALGNGGARHLEVLDASLVPVREEDPSGACFLEKAQGSRGPPAFTNSDERSCEKKEHLIDLCRVVESGDHVSLSHFPQKNKNNALTARRGSGARRPRRTQRARQGLIIFRFQKFTRISRAGGDWLARGFRGRVKRDRSIRDGGFFQDPFFFPLLFIVHIFPGRKKRPREE